MMVCRPMIVMLFLLFVSQGKATSTGKDCTADNGEVGVCGNVGVCPLLEDAWQYIKAGSASMDDKEKFLRSYCPDRLSLCCPKSALKVTNQAINFPGNSKTPVRYPGSLTTTQKPRPYLYENCGMRTTSNRIIAGTDAPPFAWPWIVYVEGRNADGKHWTCGGSLIAERYVLTAAHCMQDRRQVLFARIGEHNLATNPDCHHGVCAPLYQDISVEKTIFHPSVDMALLRLTESVKMHQGFVNPICLPENFEDDLGFPIEELHGKVPFAIGWGTTSPDADFYPDVLQQVKLTIETNQFCSFARSKVTVPSELLCAGGNGKDTCRGDSGGPLMLSNQDGTRFFLIAVTSRGPSSCGSQGTTGLYTSVDRQVPWILENITP